MAIRVHPLPLEFFEEKLRPYIRRFNAEITELAALEGTIREPRKTRRSDLTVARRETVQVDISRITPSILSVVSGSSTVVGTPGLTLGQTNTVGTTTSTVSINSAIALFDTSSAEGVSLSSSVGTVARAARRDHTHGLPLSAKGSLLSRDANELLDLPVGSNTQVLTADSTESTGIKWASAGAATDVALYVKMFVPTATTVTVPTKHQIVCCEEYSIEGSGVLDLEGTALLCIDGVAA